MPATPEGGSEPLDWGTSFGRSEGEGPGQPDPLLERPDEDSSARRKRSGGGPTGRRGTGRPPGGRSGRGRSKRAGGSSDDSPFGPVVGASADATVDPAAGGSNLPGDRVRGRRVKSWTASAPADDRTAVDDVEARAYASPEATAEPQEPARTQEEWSSEARAVLLRQLASAPRSRYQLAAKLAERDIPAAVSEPLLDRFEEVKLIDDAEFARMWVRTRASGKSLARSAMRRELADKGIDSDLAEAALLQVSDDHEQAQARELVLRRARGSTDLSDRQVRDKEVRRLVGMLARKGYSPGVGFSIVREVLDELQSEGPAD